MPIAISKSSIEIIIFPIKRIKIIFPYKCGKKLKNNNFQMNKINIDIMKLI